MRRSMIFLLLVWFAGCGIADPDGASYCSEEHYYDYPLTVNFIGTGSELWIFLSCDSVPPYISYQPPRLRRVALPRPIHAVRLGEDGSSEGMTLETPPEGIADFEDWLYYDGNLYCLDGNNRLMALNGKRLDTIESPAPELFELMSQLLEPHKDDPVRNFNIRHGAKVSAQIRVGLCSSVATFEGDRKISVTTSCQSLFKDPETYFDVIAEGYTPFPVVLTFRNEFQYN